MSSAPLHNLARGAVVLGQYRLVERLGEGLGGETWRAQGLADGVDVAIKMVQHDGARLRSHRDMLHEASLLREVEHPHVVPYLGVVDLPGDRVTFLITAWALGGNLTDWLHHHGACDAQLATKLVLQLADALLVLHKHGIIHRDLKPENVLLADDGGGDPFLLLADFGISQRAVDDSARVTRPAGSPGFTAPECWVHGRVTTAADVYSLGCILLTLLRGVAPPLRTESWAPDTARLAAELPNSVEPGSVGLGRLALTLMADSPEARPTLTAVRAALARDERAVELAREPIPSSKPVAPTPPPPPAARPGRPPAFGEPAGASPTLVLAEGEGSASVEPRVPRRRTWMWAGFLGASALGVLLVGGLVVALGEVRDHPAGTGSPPAASIPAAAASPFAAVSGAAPAEPVAVAVSGGTPAAAVEPATRRRSAVSVGGEPAPPPGAAPTPSAPAPSLPAQPMVPPEASAPDVTLATLGGSGPVAELRVGVAGPAGLPADAELVVRAPGLPEARSASSQVTLRGGQSGVVTVEVRSSTRVLASATVEVPPGEVRRVLCTSPDADFSGLRCRMK